jgi:hypothetical protein
MKVSNVLRTEVSAYRVKSVSTNDLSLRIYEVWYTKKTKTELSGLSPLVKYTDRATAKLVQIFGDRTCHVVSATDPFAVFSLF